MSSDHMAGSARGTVGRSACKEGIDNQYPYFLKSVSFSIQEQKRPLHDPGTGPKYHHVNLLLLYNGFAQISIAWLYPHFR